MSTQKIFYFVFLLTLSLSSCIKKEVTPLKDEGKTFIKIIGGGSPAEIKKNPIDFVNRSQRLLVVDLRKDAANSAALNTATTVVVKDDTAAVRAANPNYIIFPSAWYRIESEVPKVGGVGGTFTFQFKPGDFAKQIHIEIPNAQLMNPSALYALGFTITTVTPGTNISVEKSVVIEIGAKNQWDGVYAVTGPMVDVLYPTWVNWANQDGYNLGPFGINFPNSWMMHLVTTAADECTVWDMTVWEDIAHPFWYPPDVSTGYGSFGLVVKFNPTTNTIASVHNYYGDPSRRPTGGGLGSNPASGSGAPSFAASNTRRAVLDPTGFNGVQGRDILVKYFMIQTNTTPPIPAPSIRTTFDEKWTYVGPR